MKTANGAAEAEAAAARAARAAAGFAELVAIAARLAGPSDQHSHAIRDLRPRLAAQPSTEPQTESVTPHPVAALLTAS